jgi:hypothetical protein
MIFIFRPSDNWGYCGGAVIIQARDFEEAKKVWSEYRIHSTVGGYNPKNDEPGYQPEERLHESEDNGEYGWILHRQLHEDEVEHEPPHVILCNYNNA